MARLCGTPSRTAAGMYPLTLTARNPAGTATQALTLTITRPPAINQDALARGERLSQRVLARKLRDRDRDRGPGDRASCHPSSRATHLPRQAPRRARPGRSARRAARRLPDLQHHEQPNGAGLGWHLLRLRRRRGREPDRREPRLELHRHPHRHGRRLERPAQPVPGRRRHRRAAAAYKGPHAASGLPSDDLADGRAPLDIPLEAPVLVPTLSEDPNGSRTGPDGDSRRLVPKQ